MVANVATSVIDNGLASLKSAARYIHITSQEATTHAEATSTYTKGVKDFGAGGVFPGTISAVTNGRRVTTAPFTNGSVTSTGAVTHWAITDGANLLAVGPLGSGKAVTVGSLFGLGAFDIGNRYDLAPPAIALNATGLETSAAALGLPVLGAAGVIPLTATSLFTSPAAISAAILNGIGAIEPFITSKWLHNYHPTTPTPSNSYVSFGKAFRKGDIPAGSVPQAYLGDGTVIPQQYDLRNTWSDGSLRWTEVSVAVASVAALSNTPIHFRRVAGSFVNTSTRGLNDVNLTGGHDFKVVLTNVTDHLGATYNTGTMTADFNTASLVSANTQIVKSGPVCKQWRTWMLFPGQSHLACWFYVTAWTNPSGGALGTISHISKVHNGFVNVAGGQKYIYDADYRDGATIIRSFGGSTNEKQFTYAGAGNQISFATPHGLINGTQVTTRTTNTLPAGTSATFTVDTTANTFSGGVAGAVGCRVGSSGTLPGGLSATKVYYPRFGQFFESPGYEDIVDLTSAGSGTFTMYRELINSTAVAPGQVYFVRVVDANTIELCPSAGDAQSSGGDEEPIVSTGTGNHFLQLRVFHHARASWFTCDTDGRSDWTASEATIHVEHHREYVMSTNLLPSYDLDNNVNPAEVPQDSVAYLNSWGGAAFYNGTTRYFPLGFGDLRAQINAGGTHNAIGPIPAWCAMAFMTQNVTWAQLARVNALYSCGNNNWINEATGKVPTIMGNTSHGTTGNFTGLGTNMRDSYFFFPDSNGGAGLYVGVANADGGTPWGGGDGSGSQPPGDFSHAPDAFHYVTVMEGGCHNLDAQIICAGCGPLTAWNVDGNIDNDDWYLNDGRRRQISTGSAQYYGIVSGQGRAQAWQIRSFVHARAVIPDAWEEQPYFDYWLTNNADYAVAQLAVMPTGMTNNGWWQRGFSTYNLFVHSFQARAICHAAYITGDADMNTWATYMVKLYKQLNDNWRGNCVMLWGGLAIESNTSRAADNRANFQNVNQIGAFYGIGIGALNCLATFDNTTDTVTISYNQALSDFSLANGDIVRLPISSHENEGPAVAPTGLLLHTDYYIRDLAGTSPNFTCKLAATSGGAAINFTSNGTGNYFGGAYFELSCIPLVSGCPPVPEYHNPNYTLTIALGTMGAALQYGYVDVQAAYSALKNRMLASPEMVTTFSHNPIFNLKPWWWQPGAIVFVDVEAAAGGNGTTPATAYNNLKTASDTEGGTTGRNLTGTGGITFWCTGGLNDQSTACLVVPGNCVDRRNFGAVDFNNGTGNYNTWIATPSDKVRVYGNPSTLKGRNFGPAFDPNCFTIMNTGGGAPGEPGGGTFFCSTMANIVVDGIQGYVGTASTNGEGFYFNISNTGSIILRNVRTVVYQDGLLKAGGGSGYGGTGVSTGSNNLTLAFENCTFEASTPGYFNESAIAFSSSGANSAAVTNIINCTIRGFKWGVVISAPYAGTINIKNSAVFAQHLGVADSGTPALVGNFGSAAVNISYCASNAGVGSNAVTIANQTAWDANFVNEIGNNVTVTGTYWYEKYDNSPPLNGSQTNFSIAQPAGNFSVKANAANIYGAGTATGAPARDIIGRPRPAVPTIGAWER